MANPRKRRRLGSLGSVKAALWVSMCYNRDVIEDETITDHETKQKASNCLVQAGLAWLKAHEVGDLAQQVNALEALAPRTGRAA